MQKKGKRRGLVLALLLLLVLGGVGYFLVQEYQHSRFAENVEQYGPKWAVIILGRDTQKNIERIPSRLRIKELCKELLHVWQYGKSPDGVTELRAKRGGFFTAKRSASRRFGFEESKIRALLEGKLESLEEAALTELIVEFFEQ